MSREVPPEPAPTGFSSSKRSVLLLLKRQPNASLSAIAQSLEISRAAAWKHLAKLEGDGLVVRDYQRGRAGRPRARFRLAPSTARLFPEAYVQMSLSALAFIERTQGRDAVVRMLEERASELRATHVTRLSDRDLPGRVNELAKIRDEEGYMAAAHRAGKYRFELLEHNCPILAVAGRYGEACDVERKLFQNLLQADVAVRHRVVAGDPVCRFLIGRRSATSPRDSR